MALMNGEDITKWLENFKSSEHYDNVIENLILKGEAYGLLEKIIDGTVDKKFLKIMISLKAKSHNEWDEFQTLLEIGVMDGTLELSDIKSERSKARKRKK